MAADKRKPAEIVKSFYDEFGWRKDGEPSGEDQLFRAFPPAYQSYKPLAVARILKAFEGRSGTLLIVGCGDMPDSDVRLAEQFERVICVDISKVALEISEAKLGSRGTYILGSILESDLPDGSVDAAYCAHVVYHIDQAQQEAAVRQMIRLTKPGGRVVVLYANPLSPFTIPGGVLRRIKLLARAKAGAPELYYHAHTLGWWRRFRDQCRLTLQPLEAIGSRPAQALLKTNAIASAFFSAARALESRAPSLATLLWQYPMVILDKTGAKSPETSV
jgi:SAM-dependent methyltransferase